MKKHNQNGFTHHILLVSVAVLVMGAIGFAGFRVYTSKNEINAKAASYPLAISIISGQATVRACKAGSYYKLYASNSSMSVVYFKVGANATKTLNPHTTATATASSGTYVNMSQKGSSYNNIMGVTLPGSTAVQNATC